MAAAEALYTTRSGAPFSLFTIGASSTARSARPSTSRCRRLLSFLADQLVERQGRGHQRPQSALPGDSTAPATTRRSSRHLLDVPAHDRLRHSWSRRSSALGMLLLVARNARRPRGAGCAILACAIALPFARERAGWIFTEMGRQPWVVFGAAEDRRRRSRRASRRGEVGLTSLIVFTLLYGAARGRRGRAAGPVREEPAARTPRARATARRPTTPPTSAIAY